MFGEITTGAENDLEHATAVARQIVYMYGMGKSVGLPRPDGFDGSNWFMKRTGFITGRSR